MNELNYLKLEIPDNNSDVSRLLVKNAATPGINKLFDRNASGQKINCPIFIL